MNNEKYPIDKDIPLPEVRHRRSTLGYPYKEMEIGDSFFIPITGGFKEQHNASTAARMAARRANVKVVVRAVKGGIRIWRIDPEMDQVPCPICKERFGLTGFTNHIRWAHPLEAERQQLNPAPQQYLQYEEADRELADMELAELKRRQSEELSERLQGVLPR